MLVYLRYELKRWLRPVLWVEGTVREGEERGREG
jgi:hypothetical protein